MTISGTEVKLKTAGYTAWEMSANCKYHSIYRMKQNIYE